MRGNLRVVGFQNPTPVCASRAYLRGKTDFTLQAGVDWLDGMALLGIEAVPLLTMFLDRFASHEDGMSCLAVATVSSRPYT